MKRPIVGAAIHLVLGMAAAGSGDEIGTCIAVAAIACFWTAMAMIRVDSDKKERFQSVALYTVIFVFGALWYMQTDQRNVSAVSLKEGTLEEAEAVVRGTIVGNIETDGDRVSTILETERVALAGGDSVRLKERVMLYVRLDSQEEKLETHAWKRGFMLEARGVLKAPMRSSNFGAFDYADYLRRQHVHWTVHVKGLSNVTLGEANMRSVSSMLAYVDEFRHMLSQRLDRLYPAPYAGFMQGLIIGVRDGLDPDQLQQFSQIGMTHILAISGLHVAIFVGAALWLLGRTPLTRETRLTIAMLAVPLYVIVTGASPSVVRAGIMGVLGLYAARRHLLKDGLHILCFAAIAMLLWNPYYLHDVSFQLSFAVTAGLIIGVPRLNAVLPFRHQGLKSAVSVTVVAQAVSFPLTLYYFNGFSLFSLPANFAMVPLFSIIVLPVGTISLLLSFVSLKAALAAAWLAERVTEGSFWAVERLNALDWGYTIWASPPIWWIALYYAAVYWLLAVASGEAFALDLRIRIHPSIAAGAAATLLVLALVYAYVPDALDRSGTVSFIDVGQGDSIFIRTPYGKHILIDGGGTLTFGKTRDAWRERRHPYEVGEKLLVPLLKRRGVHRIDELFISHGDVDHIGGLQAVLRHIPVNRIRFNGTLADSSAFKALMESALAKSIPISPIYGGDVIRADRAATIRVLHPEEPQNRENVVFLDKQNDASLVLQLEMYKRTFLLPGDIEAGSEKFIASKLKSNQQLTAVIKADVLKLAHHGSKTSSTEEWLRLWKPSVAVISAGRNNVYRHPHPSVTDRLRVLGIPALRTDLHGEIQFIATGSKLMVRTKWPVFGY
ncbi:DNA internalization-related competence protein ComEC/Rec2 [Paenibacillus thermotolerans]|uniref:DNA internalization-related competence protein ComEC/Rec2 n=1 Tax=Paenibacillus thermotolerans TaxID=3027807 RepID=UPI002367F2C5|nr:MULTISPECIES: DNA internalization-related competence protein ComEC/Rec2 [unclassified Paenibacillus]